MSTLCKSISLVLMAVLIATSFTVASGGNRKRIADRVVDLEKAVGDLQARVAALEGKPAHTQRPAMLDPCRQWGKSRRYISNLTSDYRVLKNAGLPKAEILSSALDACIERVTSESELPACRACVTSMIEDLYKE